MKPNKFAPEHGGSPAGADRRASLLGLSGIGLTRRGALRLAAATIASLVCAGCQTQLPQIGKALEGILRTTAVAKGQAAQGAKEAIKAMSSLARPLWVVQSKELFSAYNAYLTSEMGNLCKERNWPLNLSYLSDYVGTVRETDKIVAAVRAGDPPDLILSTLPASRLYESRSLQPVTELVTEFQAKWGRAARRAVRDHFLEEEWWAVPFHQRSDGGWYRRDIWEKADIDIQALRAYPELAEACLSLSDPEEELYGWGITASHCDNGDAFIDRVITGWGGHWQDETGQYVTIASPETIEALNWLAEIYTHPRWQKMMPPNVLCWTDVSNNEAYLAGKLAYTQNGGSLYAAALLSENPLAEVTGFYPLAGGPKLQEFNGLSTSVWMMPRGAVNSDAAQAVVRHFLQEQRLDAVLAAAPAFALPAYPGLWDTSAYLPTNPVAMQQKPPATDADGIIPWFHPGPSSPAMILAASAGIRNEMVKTVLEGGLAAEAVQTAYQRVLEIFAQFGLPGERDASSR